MTAATTIILLFFPGNDCSLLTHRLYDQGLVMTLVSVVPEQAYHSPYQATSEVHSGQVSNNRGAEKSKVTFSGNDCSLLTEAL